MCYLRRIAILTLEVPSTAPGVSPCSITDYFLLVQKPIGVNRPVIPREQTLTPGQATEEIPIARADNIIYTNMDNVMNAFETKTVLMSNVNKFGYLG
jgi:hypothetical protein